MPYGIYLSSEGANAQSARLEVIANNLANVDTVGFKRQLATFQARYAEATERGLDSPGSGTINDVGGGVYLAETKTDFSPGPMKTTGAKSDVAIGGDGFFVVEKGDEKYLTRAGNFRFTEQGELVTQQGYRVLSENGAPIVVDPANGDYQIDSTGTVRQAGAAQTMALVVPASMGDLARVGENLFKPLAETTPVAADQRAVRSGCLETSGVKPITEMVRMIETTRAIEANVNMMQTQDQMLSGLVNRLMRS
jgi:flagellar basal-body rod protein FlgF/flagellar basal-body rod protein FlgG